MGKFLPPGGKNIFSMAKTALAKIVFTSKKRFLPAKTYQLVSASTAQSFNDFLLIHMSAWKCVVSLVYCTVAIASSINTTDGV